MEIRVTDLSTGNTVVFSNSRPNPARVMRRARSLYQNAKAMGVKGKLLFSYYLKYSWQLEKGHIWA